MMHFEGAFYLDDEFMYDISPRLNVMYDSLLYDSK